MSKDEALGPFDLDPMCAAWVAIGLAGSLPEATTAWLAAHPHPLEKPGRPIQNEGEVAPETRFRSPPFIGPNLAGPTFPIRS